MKDADRERYAREIAILGSRLAGATSSGGSAVDDSVVWDVYSEVERLVAVLKFRLDYETPGAFTRLPEVGDPARLLGETRELLALSGEEISGLKLVDAVEDLRKARNNLRGYLTSKRKAETRAGRTARDGAPT